MQNLVASGGAGTRYLTRMYAAVSLSEAKRLAAIDSMPFDKVQQTHNVELLHVHHTELWAWWSDGILTTGLGLKPELCPNVLTPDAEELIHTTCLRGCLKSFRGQNLCQAPHHNPDHCQVDKRLGCFGQELILSCNRKRNFDKLLEKALKSGNHGKSQQS